MLRGDSMTQAARRPVTALKSFTFEGIGVEQGERLLMPADQIPVAIDAGLVTREAPARRPRKAQTLEGYAS